MSIRETIIESGDLYEVMLGPDPFPQKKKKRAKREKMTTPKQKLLNDTRAKRHLLRLIEVNFTKRDLFIHLPYDDEHLPTTLEEAERNIKNFIRRVRYHLKKKGIELKYIYVTEHSDVEGELIRVHHHIVISGGLDRDFIEGLWECGARKRADRLKPDKRGLEGIAIYLSKAKVKKSKRRYTPSRNLDKPIITPDKKSKYSKRKLEQIASYGEDDNFFYENLYPGYSHMETKITRNEHSGGTYIYIRMRKLQI